MCPLPHLAAIDVRGADARRFLAAQLTSDVARLAPGRSQPAAWCNPQGRVIATLRVLDLGDGFRLVLAADLRERVLERLRMFVLRARVELAPADAAPSGFFGAPPGCAPETLPQHSDATTRDGATMFVRMPGPDERYLVTGTPTAIQALCGRGARVLPERWRLADIEAGLANIYAATSECFLPQMLGLDRIGGLAFDKGCYPGQEVIARLHYRGELKRRLYRGTAGGAEAPPSGTVIRTAAGESAGTVIEAARGADGAIRLLAVVADASAREQLVLESGVPLELAPAFAPPER